MKSSILKELQRIELAIRGIDPLADIAELEAAQSDMQALIAALQAADTSLQATDASLWDQIVSNSSTSANLQSQISSNDGDISGHNSRISALEAGGGGGGIEGYIWAADVKPQGTQGGTFTAGAWRVRTLNILETDLAGVTLASNIISGIPAGKYVVHLRCPAFDVHYHRAGLTTSDGDYDASVEYSVGYAQGASVVHRIVIFSSYATVTVRHRCLITQSTNGFGIGANQGPELYTQLLMLKVG